MPKFLIVIGSPGAGKTTILSSRRIRENYKVVNFGDILLDIAIKKKYVTNRDQIRYLPHSISTKLQTEAAKHVPKMEGNTILDTHASVEENGRFSPGITFNLLYVMKHTVGFVYIDASNDEIRDRRRRDRKRKREIESDLILDRQRSINIAILSYYSSSLNIPLYIIDNVEGRMKQTVSAFLKHAADAFDEAEK
jgi:adenylate kinase